MLCCRRLAVQNVARATYRDIVERRARENQVDFIEGVATAITPIAFLETVMVKGYETLVDSNTKVDVNHGMIAASRLQALIESRDNSTDIAGMRVQLGRILDAVGSVVPQSMWGETTRRLNGDGEDTEPLKEVEADAYGTGGDPLEPDDFDDFEESAD